MMKAPVVDGGHRTTPLLAYGADVLFALACAAAIPGAAHWLPLVPLLVVLPRAAGAVLQAGARRETLHWGPDPLEPDWDTLARLIGHVCRQADADGRLRCLRLSPLCREDGAPRPYAIDFDPARPRLAIHELDGGRRPTIHRLDPVPRFKGPLPVVVRQAPVTLLLVPEEAPMPGIPPAARPSPPAARRLPHPAPVPVTLFQLDVDGPAHALLPGLLLSLLTLPVDTRLSAVATVAWLTPLAAGMLGGETLRWHPWQRQPAVVTGSGVSRRFDLLRFWIGWLGLLRIAAPIGPWLRALQDPIGFLAWGCLIPLALAEGLGQIRARRYRSTVRPS